MTLKVYFGIILGEPTTYWGYHRSNPLRTRISYRHYIDSDYKLFPGGELHTLLTTLIVRCILFRKINVFFENRIEIPTEIFKYTYTYKARKYVSEIKI